MKLCEREQPQTPEEKAAEEQRKKEDQDIADRMRAYLETQYPLLSARLPKLKSAEAWKLADILVQTCDGYYDDEIETALIGKNKDHQSRVLARLFADNNNVAMTGYSLSWQDEGVRAWKLAGIDLVAGFKKLQQAAELPAKEFRQVLDKVSPKAKKKKGKK